MGRCALPMFNMQRIPTMKRDGAKMKEALARIERKLLAAEYMIDSTNTHVRRKKCDDVKPLALARYSDALNNVRSALQIGRETQGFRSPTLFAGSANPKHKSTQKRKQKAWGSHTAHRWAKDCDGRWETRKISKRVRVIYYKPPGVRGIPRENARRRSSD